VARCVWSGMAALTTMTPVLSRARRATLALAASAVLTLAGCGDDDDDASTTTRPPDSVASTTAATTTTTPATSAPGSTTTAPARVTTTTTAAATTTATTPVPAPTTAPTSTSPPSVAPTTPPPAGAVTADTPISIFGIGPVRAGMTLREAAATGVPIEAVDFDAFEGFCYGGVIDGQPDVGMLVVASGDEPPADPLDGVIGRVSLYIGVRTTTEGIHIGSTEQDVHTAYGAALQETPHVYVPDGHYLRHEDGGFAYVFETDGSVVTAIHAGDPDVVGYVEGCA
jgi:hypothetical protein